MGKLHELLAVEPDLAGQVRRTLSQVEKLFIDGQVRLQGIFRTYAPIDEGGEKFDDETTELATTVDEELERIADVFGRWLNVAIQKETTNQSTKADVIVNGNIILEGLSAPALLNLEAKLGELKKVYTAIPTIDPTITWKWNDQFGCFVSRPKTTYKTRKVMKSHVAYEATPEHPAQIETFTQDERAGTWTTIEHSGMWTPSRKRETLGRIDELNAAVKQARQRANTAEVISVEVRKPVFAFIHKSE